MKVYIVQECYDEGCSNLGIFSSKDKAEEACAYLTSTDPDDCILEMEIDPKMEGEKYQLFHNYYIRANGEEFQTAHKAKPSEIELIGFGTYDHPNAVIFNGSGLTPESAKENCLKAKELAKPVWQISLNGTEVHHSDLSHIYNWSIHYGESMCVYAVHPDRNVCIIALEEYKKGGTKFREFLRIIKQ